MNHRELFRYSLFTDDPERMLMSDFLKADFDDKWNIFSTGGKEELQALISSNNIKIESFNDIERIRKLKGLIEKVSTFQFIDLYNCMEIEIE